MKKLAVVISFILSTCVVSAQVMLPGVVASSVKSSTLTNGLVSYWSFDETSGTTATDAVGSINLTNNGATINQSGASGTSYQFAPNDYVGTYNGYKFTSAFSISLMIRTSTTTGYEAPVGNFHWTGDGYDLVRMETTGYLEWSIRSLGNGDAVVEYNTSVSDGSWHHIVLIYDGSYARMYVDGNACTPVAFTYTITYNTANRFVIGTRELDDNHWTGYIDEVCVYNRALTATEVSQLRAKNGKPN